VTNTGLKQLKGLKKLERLDIRETPVTGTGPMEIKKALPKLEIGPVPQFPDWYKTYLEQQRQREFARCASAPIMPALPQYPHANGSSGWGLRDSSGSGTKDSSGSGSPGWLWTMIMCAGLGAFAAAAGRRRRAE